MSVADIRRELDAEKSALQYSFVTPDRDEWLTDHLARLIDKMGVSSILDIGRDVVCVPSNLDFYWAEVVNGEDERGEPTHSYDKRRAPKCHPFEFFFNRKTLENLPRVTLGPGEFSVNGGVTAHMPFGESFNARDFDRVQFTDGLFAILDDDPNGDDRLHYRVFYRELDMGVPYFLIDAVQGHSGGFFTNFFEALQPLMPVVSLGLNIAFPGLGQLIGSSLLGVVGVTASPLLAQAVGNAAMGTLMSGGDYKHAIINAAAGFAGSSIGATLAAATNSQLIGAITASAARTAIAGGNVKAAITNTLIQQGARNASIR